jgi:hypothetical protein
MRFCGNPATPAFSIRRYLCQKPPIDDLLGHPIEQALMMDPVEGSGDTLPISAIIRIM